MREPVKIFLYQREGKWRAEMWRQPFSGRMVACTGWTTTRQQAGKDAKRYLRLPAPPADGADQP